MNEDEDYDEMEHECGGAPSFAWSWWALVVAFFQFWHGVGMAFQNAMEGLVISSVGAANHEVNQRDFAERAALEIETIVGGETDGG